MTMVSDSLSGMLRELNMSLNWILLPDFCLLSPPFLWIDRGPSLITECRGVIANPKVIKCSTTSFIRYIVTSAPVSLYSIPHRW